MKKVIMGLSTVLLCGAILIGCSNSSDNGKDKLVIDIFNIKVETKDQLEAIIEKYESENENVDINLTTVGGGQDASSALQAKFSANEEPAIFLLGGLSDVEKYQDYLLDVSEMESAKAAIEGTLQGATIDGIPYGVPLNIEGFSWMINKAVFHSAGVDPLSIKSYQDFVKAVETIDSKKEELGLEAVFGFSGKEDWVVGQFSNHFTAPEFDNDVTAAYETDELTFQYGERMKEYTDLLNEYNVQPILSLDYSTSVEELFTNDKVAIIHQGNWIVPTLDSLDPEFSQEKLGILPLFVDQDDQGYISAGPSWFWGVNKEKDDEVVEASKDFIDWMYTSDYGKEQIVEEFKYIPSQEGYEAESIQDPVSKEVYEMLLDGKSRVWAHNQYPNGYNQTAFFPEYQKYLNGDITWEQLEKVASEKFKEMR
ncbi:ABC transporter substrate-binding protein [Lederbergia galactosidilytica]|uniref:ABC transporter substrate-binding protein n=1 Tax=Lederbergia galactosidilytica TaxID=217031 RepID=A0A178A5Y2_9BACI|nr:ABC transporter substrate-binding protein [Lederbergia galactosidilytica]MBP1915095.1 raffinose/stachyose/melibiose transport system substrate-binding protein [Lederbergia galactosidilytica]OAK75542.1 ABC transporter substrate-binding protein [Lederbergia galactosidilytica]